VSYANRTKGIKSVPAFVRAKLRAGWEPPPNNGRGKRSVDGQYGECVQDMTGRQPTHIPGHEPACRSASPAWPPPFAAMTRSLPPGF